MFIIYILKTWLFLNFKTWQNLRNTIFIIQFNCLKYICPNSKLCLSFLCWYKKILYILFFCFRSKAGHAECSIISTPHWAHMSSSPLSQVVHFVINNAAIVKEYRKSIHYVINNFAKSKSKKRKYPV